MDHGLCNVHGVINTWCIYSIDWNVYMGRNQTNTSYCEISPQCASITCRDYSPARRDVYNVWEIPCLYSVYRFTALHYTVVCTRAWPPSGDHEWGAEWLLLRLRPLSRLNTTLVGSSASRGYRWIECIYAATYPVTLPLLTNSTLSSADHS